jgi:hypothetical protein
MAVEFQCEHCGELISADGDAGMEVTCPFCENATIIPEGLAGLPTPQIPGEESDTESYDYGDAESDLPESPDENLDADAGDDGDGEDGEGDEFDEEEMDGETTPFMEFLAKAMPWMVTVVIHAAVFLLLVVLVAVTIQAIEDAQDIPIPDANITDNPGGSMSPTDSPMIDKTQSVKPSEARQSEVESTSSVDTGELETEVTSYGVAGGGASGGNPFGSGDAGGGGSPGSFFGNGGTARHIVYVIDRSGSMHGTFDAVRVELLRAVSRLDPELGQDFHVILFATGRPLEKSPKSLTLATDEYKSATGEFMADVVPFGQTDPIPALEEAFEALKGAPAGEIGLIQLLTDGSFPDNAATLEAVARLNRNGDAMINTFLYGFRPKEAEDVLRQIANDNGGRYKYVSPDEFD